MAAVVLSATTHLPAPGPVEEVEEVESEEDEEDDAQRRWSHLNLMIQKPVTQNALIQIDVFLCL